MPFSRTQILAIAELLDELVEDIERIGTSLCDDPHIIQSKITELQAIDLIAQKQRSIADVLRADCSQSAWRDIGLEQIQQRIKDAMDMR